LLAYAFRRFTLLPLSAAPPAAIRHADIHASADYAAIIDFADLLMLIC